jgi:hypothetical protein
MRRTMALCCTLAVALAAGQLGAQDAKKPAAPQGMPPMPTAGPEHELLKNEAGTWDATVEMLGMGPTPATSKGSENNTLMANGLWLITDFKSEMMGMPFHGHGTSGWDPGKKKYVGTWVDSMSPGVFLFEGTYDASTKTLTSVMVGPDMTGKMQKMRSVSEYKSPDSRTFSMYAVGPDGKEALNMRISYTRRK